MTGGHGVRAGRLGSYVAAGFFGGLMFGLAAWHRQLRLHRRALFSRQPLRRWVALGYISSQPSVDNAQLLSDYVRWEQRPRLRRKGERALKRMQEYLG